MSKSRRKPSGAFKAKVDLAAVKSDETVAEAKAGIASYMNFYNHERLYEALGYRTAWEVHHGRYRWVHVASSFPFAHRYQEAWADKEGTIDRRNPTA